ncbi:MAG: glycosyl hydrolase [Pseudomonadota bacterium]
MKQSFLIAAMLAGAGAGAQQFVASPYKHLAMGMDASHVIQDARGKPYLERQRGTLSWAFATGECGDEHWGEVSGADVARANVAAFDQAGVGYIVSTGGEGGVFTCASDAGMERFVARYASKHLAGIDFDIEAGQSAAQVLSLVQRARHAQKKWPRLRFSFTVATHAASDGSRRSLNAQGETILAAVRHVGLKNYTFNLMVMDYGVGEAANCVVREGRCDMGASALQAAQNVHGKYRIPFEQIELTAMIGVNDVAENVFTPADANTLVQAARLFKLAGLHFWSLDRDQPCSVPEAGASAKCSTLAGVAAGEFARILTP